MIPSSWSSLGESHDGGGGAPERVEIGDLRAHVRVEADDLESGASAETTADVANRVHRDTEFVRIPAGRDVRVAAGIDVRIHPQRHARACLALARQQIDPLELPFRFGVYGFDAEIDRLRQLGGRLADAGKDNLFGNEAGAQRDVDLAAGVRVRARAKAAHQPRDGERRVGLERVVQRVRIRAKCIVYHAITGGDGAGAVDVKRCAFGGGKLRQWHTLAHEGVV